MKSITFGRVRNLLVGKKFNGERPSCFPSITTACLADNKTSPAVERKDERGRKRRVEVV